MAISARLVTKTQLALARYCKAHGITKTEALERGINLLLQQEDVPHHAAYTAYLRLQEQLSEKEGIPETGCDSASRQQKSFLDAKYPA